MPDKHESGSPSNRRLSPLRLVDQTLAKTDVAMRIYDQYFGHPPYGRIAITQQPEFSFGQSWPGWCICRSARSWIRHNATSCLAGTTKNLTDFIQEVTPHEVSHQWWGHMVGWASYRDQWLSEGFADFSAGLFMQLTEKKPEKYLKYLEAARDKILKRTNSGRARTRQDRFTWA